MASTAVRVQQIFNGKVNEKFSASKLRNAARLVAQKEIELIRLRTSRGLDRDNKPFPQYRSNYANWKKNFIKRGWAYNKRNPGGGYKVVKAKVTAFAADKTAQFMQLTGRLFSDMYVKNQKVSKGNGLFIVTYELDFKTARSKRIAAYHNVNGAGRGKVLRKFWGSVKTPKELALLKKEFLKALK